MFLYLTTLTTLTPHYLTASTSPHLPLTTSTSPHTTSLPPPHHTYPSLPPPHHTLIPHLASFPAPARSSLAVQNSRRGPGLVHHVMCAAAYVTAISLRINDVIGWASTVFYIERGSQRSQWRFVRKLSQLL